MYSASSPLLRQLESLTTPFRLEKAREHDTRAAEARREYTRHVDAWIDAVCASGDLKNLSPRRLGDAWEGPPSHLSVEMRGGLALVPRVEWEVAEAQRCVTTQKWHEERARGQRFRIPNLKSCGVRVRTVTCGVCGEGTRDKPVPEGCGVARLCPRCALFAAKKRRARFGRARERCMKEAPAHLYRDKRKGGCYSERMLTVTQPHFTRDDLEAYAASLEARVAADDDPHPKLVRRLDAARKLLAKCKDTVVCRVQALWDAWPKLMRLLNRHWKQARETIDGSKKGPVRPKVHRAAEWTLGHDGLGHPHYHAWIFSPFLDIDLVREWWTEALLDAGVPPPQSSDGLAVAHLKRIYKFDTTMAAELMKGANDRSSLELSRVHYIERDAGGVIFQYADGWTIQEVIHVARPEVIASLYEALEGKRLTQASRGFFLEEDPPMCKSCLARGGPNGSARFRCTHGPNHDHPDVAAYIERMRLSKERAPP